MKETTYQKNKRLLLEARQQLYKVCTDPESAEAKSIIYNQKFLKACKDIMMHGNYFDTLKKVGLGLSPFISQHYEEIK